MSLFLIGVKLVWECVFKVFKSVAAIIFKKWVLVTVRDTLFSGMGRETVYLILPQPQHL